MFRGSSKHKAEPGVADDAYGIQEIITDAMSIPPCQYGVLQWKEDGSMEYSTESVDVSAWENVQNRKIQICWILWAGRNITFRS